MAREIKFRGRTLSGRWVYGLLSHKDGEWFISNEAGVPLAYKIRPETRSQYTGLKDKNGREIFEADILADGAVVEWFDNLAWDSGGSLHSGFYTRKWAAYDSDEVTTELSYYDGFDECEVIGNIYSNPELLKDAA